MKIKFLFNFPLNFTQTENKYSVLFVMWFEYDISHTAMYLNNKQLPPPLSIKMPIPVTEFHMDCCIYHTYNNIDTYII